ncbi:MAG: gliding motility-associated C-terminal domain-containing protein [Cyclobacteriaceae bacterium]
MSNKVYTLFFLFQSVARLALSQCWQEVDKLLPDKGFNNTELLGVSLDYQDNLAVVGAPQSDSLVLNAGVVYLFEFDNSWKKIATLVPSEPRNNHGFGRVVRISGDYIYVGDPFYTEGVTNKGRIYVYKKPVTGWATMTETFIIEPTDPKARQFGEAIAIDEDELLIGAPFTIDNNGLGIGAAYIYKRLGDSWSQEATFYGTNALGSTFGKYVTLGNNMAVVSSDREILGSSSGVGNIYVFEKSDLAPWTDALPNAKLSNSINASYLGTGLAIDETRQTVFVSGEDYDGLSQSTKKVLFSFVKPVTGWQDMTETSIYYNDIPELYYFQGRVEFEEPYLYLSVVQGVKVFKPDVANSWNTLNPISLLQSADYFPTNQFGTSLRVSNGHVLVGASANHAYNPNYSSSPSPGVYEFIQPAITGWEDNTYNEDYQFTYMPLTSADFAFGTKIDIDGEYAVVGSPRDIAGGRISGAAYVYQLVGFEWKKIATLTSSDGERNDYFGSAVAISKNHIAIGAPNKDYRQNETGKVIKGDMGAVYLFEKPAGGWTTMTESRKLIKFDSSLDRDDNFGTDVDLDYPYLVVSRYHSGSRPNLGAAFVYNIAGGIPQLEARLDPSTRNDVNNFGHAVKIKNGVIIVSCGNHRFPTLEANLVFVYVRNGDRWTDSYESAKLYPSDATQRFQGIAFGQGIDMNESATRIIVGAPFWREATDDLEHGAKGAAYIYEMPIGGWQGNIAEVVRLTIPDQPSYGCMGTSVYIEDRYAVVGSPQNYFYHLINSNPGPGRAYFYEMPEAGWSYKLPDKTIIGDESNNTTSDYFGSTVGGVHGYLMIGAIADDNQNSVDAGSVYVYTEYPVIFPPQPVCDNETSIQLDAYPAGGTWSGVGITNPSTGIFNPSVAGKGITRIRYKMNDCDASNSLLLEVRESVAPFVLAESDQLYFCGNPAIPLTAPAPKESDWEYRWKYSPTPNNITELPNNLPTLNVGEEGFYTAEVTNACSAQSATVWVGDLYPDAGEGYAVCSTNDPITLHGNYADGQWSGVGISDNDKFVSSVAGLGKHILRYSVSPQAGCVYEDTREMTVKGIDNLDIVLQNEDQFCYMGYATMSATPLQDVSYAWFHSNDGSAFNQLNEVSNVLEGKELGQYKVKVYDGLCTYESTYELVPFFKPSLEPTFDSISFCAIAPLKVEAESITNAKYEWMLYDGESEQLLEETRNSFSVHINESGTFRLKISNYGCEYVSPLMSAQKIPSDSLFVPNVITPNGDNKNDVLEVYKTEGIGTYALTIINRYGKEVYTYTGEEGVTGWSGGDLSTGTYFWVLSYYNTCEKRVQVFKGTVTLLR